MMPGRSDGAERRLVWQQVGQLDPAGPGEAADQQGAAGGDAPQGKIAEIRGSDCTRRFSRRLASAGQ